MNVLKQKANKMFEIFPSECLYFPFNPKTILTTHFLNLFFFNIFKNIFRDFIYIYSLDSSDQLYLCYVEIN